jgi:preprotein translocase subunit YajC
MSALILLLIPLALYFLMIRPQRQRVQAQRSLVNGLGPGDRVVTAGGMVGTLVAMDGEHAAVELAPGVIVEFLAPAIIRRAPDEEGPDEEGPAEPGVAEEGVAAAREVPPGLEVPDDLSGLDVPDGASASIGDDPVEDVAIGGAGGRLPDDPHADAPGGLGGLSGFGGLGGEPITGPDPLAPRREES